jgi:hypothetical protein
LILAAPAFGHEWNKKHEHGWIWKTDARGKRYKEWGITSMTLGGKAKPANGVRGHQRRNRSRTTGVGAGDVDPKALDLMAYDNEQASKPKARKLVTVQRPQPVANNPRIPILTLQQVMERRRELSGQLIRIKVDAVEEGFAFDEAGNMIQLTARSSAGRQRIAAASNGGQIQGLIRNGATLSLEVR